MGHTKILMPPFYLRSMLKSRFLPCSKHTSIFWHCDPTRVMASSFLRVFPRPHTTKHHSRYYSSGRVISSSQRLLPDNTKQSQQKNIHAPGGIRTHDLNRRAAADLCLRPRGHWDRPLLSITKSKWLLLLTVTIAVFYLDKLQRFRILQQVVHTIST